MVEHSSTAILSEGCNSRMDGYSLLLFNYDCFILSCPLLIVQQSQEVPSPPRPGSSCQSIMGSSTWERRHTKGRVVPSREAAGSEAGKEHGRSKIQLTPTNQRNSSVPLTATHMLGRRDQNGQRTAAYCLYDTLSGEANTQGLCKETVRGKTEIKIIILFQNSEARYLSTSIKP